MEFETLRQNWHRFGEIDPLGAILTEAGGTGRWSPERFFETGRQEIAEVVTLLKRVGLPSRGERALDFGCGVGRLTQALCDHFDECHGVDIAASMIEHARRFNRHGPRAHYHLNERSDLELFGDDRFDFVYSNLVLQHMKPEYMQVYLREFIRVLQPGGILVFQLPAHQQAQPMREVPEDDQRYRATVTIESPPKQLAADSVETLRIGVRNEGDTTWPGGPSTIPEQLFSVGNHWLDESGRLLVNDDGRSMLPRPVRPGAEDLLDLTVRAPASPGRYVLEVDLVHENVCWFAAAGSAPTRVPIEITSAHQGPLPSEQSEPGPVMEVYGTPREQIVALLEEFGARTVNVERYDAAGPAWISFRYVARKR